mmetsp:Transcript_34280/g.107401  ORF Transcript_34280/g.107401 Transcript_34280/m.107401 type:complete len:422 (+) Transcript_34280:94-1359(+)
MKTAISRVRALLLSCLLLGTANLLRAQCPAGYYQSAGSCKICLGYEFNPTQGMAVLVAQPCPKGKYLKNACHYGNSTTDSVCMSCTYSSTVYSLPAGAAYGYPLRGPEVNDCDVYCVNSYAYLYFSYNNDRYPDCRSCSRYCPPGQFIDGCGGKSSGSCVACFGYNTNNQFATPFACPPGTFLFDACPSGYLADMENKYNDSGQYPSRCLPCSSFRPLHSEYLYPLSANTDTCQWRCRDGYQKVTRNGIDFCEPCSAPCYPNAVELGSAETYLGPGQAPEELISCKWIWSDSSGFSGSVPQGTTVRLETTYNLTSSVSSSQSLPAEIYLMCLNEAVVILNDKKVAYFSPYGMENTPMHKILVQLQQGLNALQVYVTSYTGDGGLLLSAMSSNVTLFNTSAEWTWSEGGAGPGTLIAWDELA